MNLHTSIISHPFFHSQHFPLLPFLCPRVQRLLSCTNVLMCTQMYISASMVVHVHFILKGQTQTDRQSYVQVCINVYAMYNLRVLSYTHKMYGACICTIVHTQKYMVYSMVCGGTRFIGSSCYQIEVICPSEKMYAGILSSLKVRLPQMYNHV